MLFLVWQLRLDFFLDSPQQERPQHLMQTVDDQQLFFFIQTHRLLFSSFFTNSNRKPLLKVIAAVEDFRQQKVQQSP